MIDYKVSIRQEIVTEGRKYDLEQSLLLLKALQKNENLRLAAEACGFSYRKAWNLLKELEDLLGGTLVHMLRGRGSQLTPLGLSLVQLALNNEQEFELALQKSSSNARQVLNQILPGEVANIFRIVASDSDILNRLRERILNLPMLIDVGGSLQALVAYSEGRCDVAGFHLATGQRGHASRENYFRYFNSKEDCFVFLEQRQQGLLSRIDAKVTSLQQIIDENLLFVNRQRGSGTRNLLDSLLIEQGFGPGNVRGYFHEEHTHLAVATMVATGQADVGLAVATVAQRMQLHFVPLVYENYFLVFKKVLAGQHDFKTILKSIFEDRMPEILDEKQFLKIANTEIIPR